MLYAASFGCLCVDAVPETHSEMDTVTVAYHLLGSEFTEGPGCRNDLKFLVRVHCSPSLGFIFLRHLATKRACPEILKQNI